MGNNSIKRPGEVITSPGLYHLLFRIFTITPALWFILLISNLLINIPIPRLVALFMLFWFYVGIIFVPMINALGRHYILVPALSTNDTSNIEIQRSRFSLDAALTIGYVLLVIFSPVISLII